MIATLPAGRVACGIRRPPPGEEHGHGSLVTPVGVAKRGGLVVYLTSTPFQLAPFLLKSLRDAGFPEGPVFLRWLGIKRFGHKWRMLHRILSNLDNQRVFLIGDSGEQDLQIYRRICDTEAFREKIAKVLIRHVPGTPLPALVDSREALYSNLTELREHLAELLNEPEAP